MQLYRPVLTQHRLQRFVLWTLVMLSWLAAILFGHRKLDARRAHQRGDVSLHSLTRLVTALLLVRALHIVGRAPNRRCVPYWLRGRDKIPTHFRRSFLGAKLRRRLTHPDPATHIAQLIALLRNLDKHAAHLAHCMLHRRRRLWRRVPAIASAALILGVPAPTPAFADSS
jgi:hypothetical protein